MPPASVSDLRLIHASCRKAHGPSGADELPTGDSVIADSFNGPDDRPHQMFLTGDQIYADDVSMALLFMLQDAAEALGFAPEKLPLAAGLKLGSDPSLVPESSWSGGSRPGAFHIGQGRLWQPSDDVRRLRADLRVCVE